MIAVILAGGSGTRFWPVSREDRPKQLIRLFDDRPMVTHTVERVRPCADDVIVVTGEALLEATRDVVDLAPEAFVAEPAARNTAPAIGLAAIVCNARFGDDVIAVLPSDHYVRDEEAFRERLATAATVAESGWIVTLGITPTHPETGYGYIRFDPESSVGPAFEVEAFVEKPDRETAARYLSSRRVLWNAGIFLCRPSVMLAEIARQRPEMAKGLSEIAAAIGTDAYDSTVRRVFPTLESISIDYAVMEGAERVAVVPADVGWSDVGHWGALDAVRPVDDHGNVGDGELVLVDSRDCVVVNQSEDAVVAVVGMHDVIIVRTDDATLVLPRDRAQDVREIVAELKRRGSSHT